MPGPPSLRSASGLSRPTGYERRIVPLLFDNKFGSGVADGATVGGPLGALEAATVADDSADASAEVDDDGEADGTSAGDMAGETAGLATGVSVAAGDTVASDPVDFAPEHAASITAADAQITRAIR